MRSERAGGGKAITIAQADAGLLGVDVVEDALVPDLALGGQADEAPDVRLRGPGRPAAGAGAGPGRGRGRGGRPLGRRGGGRRRRWRFRRHGRRGIPGRARLGLGLGLGMRVGAGREEEETLASGRSDAQIPLVRSLSSLRSIKTGLGWMDMGEVMWRGEGAVCLRPTGLGAQAANFLCPR